MTVKALAVQCKVVLTMFLAPCYLLFDKGPTVTLDSGKSGTAGGIANTVKSKKEDEIPPVACLF